MFYRCRVSKLFKACFGLYSVYPSFLFFARTARRRSRYVTLPWSQNFWMTTNRKTSFKTVCDFIDLVQFQLVCQMVAKFSGVKFDRTVFKFRKRKKKGVVFT